PSTLYVLSLHDALPIFINLQDSISNLRLYNANWKNRDLTFREYVEGFPIFKKSQFGSIQIKFSRQGSTEHFVNTVLEVPVPSNQDRKSTRLNSSHVSIS